ncbi:hypothetical protein LNKW23_01980 [Paralimibaculum aggregatum]|uniref:Uncharacterized protein n=1 Tax=Paralimibaculum aggregatum TaxID=3036245 RepID=A0ABQ6LC95_9RHOB|nr:hypothetical protein LNKW23_01980 [Limibaculum sp. NKW23]
MADGAGDGDVPARRGIGVGHCPVETGDTAKGTAQAARNNLVLPDSPSSQPGAATAKVRLCAFSSVPASSSTARASAMPPSAAGWSGALGSFPEPSSGSAPAVSGSVKALGAEICAAPLRREREFGSVLRRSSTSSVAPVPPRAARRRLLALPVPSASLSA